MLEMGINAMWIGANDKHREGTMVWVSDKTNVSKGFSNWYPGEPNNSLHTNIQKYLITVIIHYFLQINPDFLKQ
jgi:hypothetical protein